MEYEAVVGHWKTYSDAIRKLGGEVKTMYFEPPATSSEIFELENHLGIDLPSSLKDVLNSFSRKAEFKWFLPDEFELTGELSQIFCGELHWSLPWIIQFNKDKEDWINKCFPEPNDPYDAIWHNKLVFQEVGNGDYLAIDLADINRQTVVYLSHDDGEGHGFELAPDFKEFLILSSELGCVGAEDWQWLPFTNNKTSYLDPNCKNAFAFKSALTLEI